MHRPRLRSPPPLKSHRMQPAGRLNSFPILSRLIARRDIPGANWQAPGSGAIDAG
jgi:hypothetical protein